MQNSSISGESSPSYTSSTLPSTQSPDECQLKGHCNMTINSFLSLGDCLNCYCQCAWNTSTSAQWTKNCCNPGEVWNPNAWPNPNSCDNPEKMEICTENSGPSQRKLSHFLILLTVALIIYLPWLQHVWFWGFNYVAFDKIHIKWMTCIYRTKVNNS